MLLYYIKIAHECWFVNRWLVVAAALSCLAVLLFFAFHENTEEGKVHVRIGFFPNMLHGQALAGRAEGAFDRALSPDASVQMIPFNAGPSVIEAMFADELDIAYIGPNPAINGYVKSNGKALRIISGAASGGAVLVVRNGSGIVNAADALVNGVYSVNAYQAWLHIFNSHILHRRGFKKRN